jgi:two-component sensor histidine kinase
MFQGDLRRLEAVRALRLTPRRGYAAAAAIYLLASAIAFLILPAVREAPFLCYVPAIALATLAGGRYPGALVALGGGLAIWLRLYPVSATQDALALMLYVDAAAVLLYAMDLLNHGFDTLIGERDRARLLFSEAQHRTANTLMFISGFLRGQRRAIQQDPASAVPAFDQAIERLDVLSSVHHALAAPGPDSRSLLPLFQRLCEGLIEAAGARHVTVQMEIDPTPLAFEQTVLLSLLLTEIVTNALKHAFADRESGLILVLLTAREGEHIFEVRDNGRGLDGAPRAVARAGTGHQIMETLAAQLGGTLTRTDDGGLRTRVTFPGTPAEAPMSLSGMFAAA